MSLPGTLDAEAENELGLPWSWPAGPWPAQVGRKAPSWAEVAQKPHDSHAQSLLRCLVSVGLSKLVLSNKGHQGTRISWNRTGLPCSLVRKPELPARLPVPPSSAQ